MVYYNNILCVSGSEIIRSNSNPDGIISKSLWDKWVKTGAQLLQRGGNGRTSLISFDSVPDQYKEIIRVRFGTPAEVAVQNTFLSKITPDPTAVTFYTNYKLADGRSLEAKYVKEYCDNASVLNAVRDLYTNQTQARRALGGSMKGFWKKAAAALNEIRDMDGGIKHTLPSSHDRLQKKYKEYTDRGFEALISGKFCNDNTVKVTAPLERLLMSLYVMPNKPFGSDVYTMYHAFLSGKLTVVDSNTGEVFSPADFTNEKGELITISEKTVWNHLNKAKNRVVVDAKRNNGFSYNTMHRPHHHRRAPEFSFSKISMDDRDLPRLNNEGGRVKAYYAYDVTSGCVIGKAYSRTKDEELFIECMRDMFRLIERENWGMPLEVEVENHLVSKFFDDLAMMFPFVRICNPGNSQEKHAEHLNRAKKYGVEKKLQNGIGRWWSRHEAYRTDNNKVNDQYVEKVYTFDSLVADDLAAIKQFNNQLHPKQKKYPGKTRWQVLLENMNPKAPQVSKPVVYKAIGERTVTTIKRNHSLTVQYCEYGLPNPNVIDKLQTGNYGVEAYYLPNADGNIGEVYVYQGERYLCCCERVNEYNTAKAEWTEGVDDVAYTVQAKYVSQFDAKVKQGKKSLSQITILQSEELDAAANLEVAPVQPEILPTPIDDIDDIVNRLDTDNLGYINNAEDSL